MCVCMCVCVCVCVCVWVFKELIDGSARPPAEPACLLSSSSVSPSLVLLFYSCQNQCDSALCLFLIMHFFWKVYTNSLLGIIIAAAFLVVTVVCFSRNRCWVVKPTLTHSEEVLKMTFAVVSRRDVCFTESYMDCCACANVKNHEFVLFS